VPKVGCETLSGTTNYLYDGFNPLEEVDNTGSVLAQYTQGRSEDGEPLSELRSGTTSYYQQDGIESVSSLTSATGVIGSSYAFDSFGQLTAHSGTLANPFQFTGREFDSETGIYFHRARYLDPSTGRFLSEDPIRSGKNFYAYVHNDPIKFVDPFGLQDSASPWQVGWEWLTGRGPRTHHFTLSRGLLKP
jgi:RHS repeat-associated protein